MKVGGFCDSLDGANCFVNGYVVCIVDSNPIFSLQGTACDMGREWLLFGCLDMCLKVGACMFFG